LTRALLSVTALLGASAMAFAQTTVTLDQPMTEVVWATLRGGSFADVNDQSVLATRSADNHEYSRRALLKFNTERAIPKGAAVTSAFLTVTVKGGSDDRSRTIGAYQVTQSWTETEVTWRRRRNGQSWHTPGGAYGSKLDEAVVSNRPGTKITFDVTPLVKAAVAGDLGSSRYTRIALIDLEDATSDSYRTYATPEDSSVGSRPVLKVTYGGKKAPDPKPTPKPKPAPDPTPAPEPSSGSTSTLRVLHWNTHHGGVGTDGHWDPARLVTWIAKFNPDVISLNEMERKTGWSRGTDEPATIAALLQARTGKTWHYKFQTLGGGANGIGCMVLSRFPIDASEPRLLTGERSAINIGIVVNGRVINFTSTHLHPDSAGDRRTEIGELTSWQRGMPDERIIAGDFNASYTSSENATMTKTYYDAWAEAQDNDTDTAYTGNMSGNTRNGRIDFIYYAKEAKHLKLKSAQVFDTRDSRGIAPSDHKPLMAIFTIK